MRKQYQRNGYSVFVEKYAKEHNISRAEGFRVAEKAWQDLTDEKKNEYKRIAKGDHPEKYNSMGIPLSVINNKIKENERMESKETTEIENIVSTSLNNNTLVKHEFSVISTNIYCIVKNTYLTCEVAVVNFSLENGVHERKYHTLIDVGAIPTGYSREALTYSRENGIPMPPINGEGNLLKILAELIAIIQPKDNPVYTMPDKKSQVSNFLEQLCDNAGQDVNDFRLYSLPTLFFRLRNAFSQLGGDAFPTISMPLTHLEKDVYKYVKNMGCEFHEEGEKYHMCALKTIKSWCYIICDSCCELAGISLEPGMHVPLGSNVDAQECLFYPDLPRVTTGSPSRYRQSPTGPPAWQGAQEAALASPQASPQAAVADDDRPDEQWPSLGSSKGKRGSRR